MIVRPSRKIVVPFFLFIGTHIAIIYSIMAKATDIQKQTKAESLDLPEPEKRPRRGLLRRWWDRLVWLVLILIVASGGAAAGGYYYFSRDLPDISKIADYRHATVSLIMADSGRTIGRFGRENRFPIALDQLPDFVVDAFVAVEDERFFKHPGVDLKSILRAFIKNKGFGPIVQGGSTITQQVARSFFLTGKRSYARKIREILLALKLEQTLKRR